MAFPPAHSVNYDFLTRFELCEKVFSLDPHILALRLGSLHPPPAAPTQHRADYVLALSTFNFHLSESGVI